MRSLHCKKYCLYREDVQMKCPSCGASETYVIDSRSTDDDTSIRRRRKCKTCEYRFTTYERMGDNPIIVVKSDGSSEAYDSEKLFRGLIIACAKRPVTSEQILQIIDDIEQELRNNMVTEIKSKELGQAVINRLAHIDEVAYVRFASVYMDFQSTKEFSKLLETMGK